MSFFNDFWLGFDEAGSVTLKRIQIRIRNTAYNNTSGIRVGMKLEAIDPLHQSLICVVSVAEVLGIVSNLIKIPWRMTTCNQL